MTALPNSLRLMIEEAQGLVERWREDGSEGDEADEYSAVEWTERLSRGEYDESLFLECQAEDCEAAGDWNGAKAAYRRLIELESRQGVGFASSHLCLSGLHAVLGEHRDALVHARLATKLHAREDLLIRLRVAICHEAALLLTCGRWRAARKAVQRGLDTFTDQEDADALSYARLVTMRSAWEMAIGDQAAARASLQEAWNYLEALTTTYASCLPEGSKPSGICSARAGWWRQEAKRRGLAGDGAGEIEACRHALDDARDAAEGWNRLSSDASVMRASYHLADAMRRHGQAVDADQYFAEAEVIRQRWRLPEASDAMGPSQQRWRQARWQGLRSRLLGRLFRKRQ